MKKRLLLWEAAGFLFTAAVGALLHFTYDWSGGTVLAAAFSAVNESTWEHMKLLFFPVFFFSVIQVCFLGHNYPNVLSARAAGTLAGLVLIPTLFYTYTGVFGRHWLWADIAVFLIAAAAVYAVDFLLLERRRPGGLWRQVAGLLVLWLLAFLFIYFTFRPPQLPLWQDPVTGLYGIPLS